MRSQLANGRRSWRSMKRLMAVDIADIGAEGHQLGSLHELAVADGDGEIVVDSGDDASRKARARARRLEKLSAPSPST